MSQTIRVIVVNADEEATPELRAHLLSVEGVKIVAEIEEPAFLAKSLDQFPAEVLLLHLDPNPAAMMEVVAPVIEARKDHLAAIAMTENRDAELVMRAMRAGMREFLWKPFPPEQLKEILQRIGNEQEGSSKRLGRLVPVCGACGGLGVTTLVTNVAVELAQLEDWGDAPSHSARPRVAIVDLDFRFGQAAMFLDAQPTYTIAELCDTPEALDVQMIERAMVKHSSGVHLLAPPTDMAQAERITAGQCAGVLSAVQECYDFVIIDGPVRFDPTARAVFDIADVCLVMVQLLVPPVRNTDRMLRELARGGYNMERIRLVCSRFGRDSGYLHPGDVETTLGRKLEFLIPDDWKTSSTAVNMGAPLLDYAPRSKLRQSYQAIALALAQRDGGGSAASEHEEDTPRKGLFSFLAGQKSGT
ncbi:MAG: hypothetical protein KKB50_18215 [Planctomycetes bacterium]|nr:hypothetical protein [Planctomycetota bacterium]